MNLSKLLIFSYLFFLLSCSNYNYINYADKTYESPSPCEPRVIKKFSAGEANKFELIGHCEAKAPSGQIGNRNKNNAMDQLLKCACENGGELIQIVDHIEKSRLNLPDIRNQPQTVPESNRKRTSDRIYAYIFVNLE